MEIATPCDQLAYVAPDRLFSLRAETKDGRPFSHAPPAQNPRVCRLRELPEQRPPVLIRELNEFNLRVFGTVAPPTGEYFLIEGIGGSQDQRRRLLKVFDATGKELATLPTERETTSQTASHVMNPTGSLLGVNASKQDVGRITLFEMPSRRVVGSIVDFYAICLSPDGNVYGGSRNGFALVRRNESEAFVVFDENEAITIVQPQFDATGTRLSWGRIDGTVLVANLSEVHRRLAELGLEW